MDWSKAFSPGEFSFSSGDFFFACIIFHGGLICCYSSRINYGSREKYCVMNEISIVCCYNNEKMYNDFVGTVNSQSIPCEVIGINNCGNKTFTSCAAAYNSVINQIKTKYVIYSHQDIVLQDSDSLKKFLSYLERRTRVGGGFSL